MQALTDDAHRARLASPSRIDALRATGLLDDTPNAVLDRLTRLATRLLGVSISVVTLVDAERQYFPGMTGLDGPSAADRGNAIAYSFCQHVVATGEPLVITNAAVHPLVRENLGHTEMGIIAYAGMPLTTRAGETLGTLCAVEKQTRVWSDDELETLRDLAASAMSEIELRTTLRTLAASQEALIDAHERLAEQATRDELTGLLNRRGFVEQVRRALANASRTGERYFLLNVDLDGFKAINDTFGHEAGDAALVEVAAILERTFRAGDVVARMGGDEFVVFAAHGSEDAARAACDRLRRALDDRNTRPDRRYALAASIGTFVVDPTAGQSLGELLNAADQAMFADKRTRKAAA